MKKNTEDTIYVRNARPNARVLRFAGIRYLLGHRGSLTDSAALPAEARQDSTIARWLQNRDLEEISRQSFTKLASRTVDVMPNAFLKRSLRDKGGHDTPLVPAEGDTTGMRTQVDPRAINAQINESLTPKWAGELMTTEEELEEMVVEDTHANYPSRHRGDEEARRKQMGY